MRGKQTIGAGILALALVSAAGWAAQAATSETAAGQAAAAKTPARAAAVDGHQIVQLPNANVPNFQRRTLNCPAGKKVVGGGAEARGNGAVLIGSFPTNDGRGWIAVGRQNGSSTVGITVYAICANP